MMGWHRTTATFNERWVAARENGRVGRGLRGRERGRVRREGGRERECTHTVIRAHIHTLARQHHMNPQTRSSLGAASRCTCTVTALLCCHDKVP